MSKELRTKKDLEELTIEQMRDQAVTHVEARVEPTDACEVRVRAASPAKAGAVQLKADKIALEFAFALRPSILT